MKIPLIFLLLISFFQIPRFQFPGFNFLISNFKFQPMKTSRRNFLKTAAVSVAAASLSDITGLASTFVSPVKLPGPAREGPSVMGLTCEPLNSVRIGLIGVGMRGMEGVERLLNAEGVEISAVCDMVPERVAKAKKIVTDKGRKEPAGFSAGEDDWRKLCERDDVDLVYSCTPWSLHTPIAVYAMNHGKHAAVEVPAATTLVRTFGGKTILIQHDTTSPRPYSRIHLLSGTRRIARKWPSQKIALEPEAHKWLQQGVVHCRTQ